MATMAATLRQVPYFADLDEPRLRALAASVRERTCDAGTMVLLEGEPCKGLGFVVSGRVKVFKVSHYCPAKDRTTATGYRNTLRRVGWQDAPGLDEWARARTG